MVALNKETMEARVGSHPSIIARHENLTCYPDSSCVRGIVPTAS
jgi:hypothetical protein